MEIPFSRFSGCLKQLDVSKLPDIFDVFFPRFRTEHHLNSFVTRGRGRVFFGDYLAIGGDSVSFLDRGRERRFAGDESLPRKRYYCIEDSTSNPTSNNTLLRELFAYADPRIPLMPVLLDSTVDTEEAAQITRQTGWDGDTPSIYHIVPERQEAWLLSPVARIPAAGVILRYPLLIVQETIEKCVDLRLPETLQWLFDTLADMEAKGEGNFDAGGKEKIIHLKGPKPVNRAEFLLTLLSQNLGGGTPFIQGIGSWLRSNGVEAFIFPSARADSLSIIRNGIVENSYGYVLVDYRGASTTSFQSTKFFGGLPAWRERILGSVVITSSIEDDEEKLDIQGVRRLQEFRFAVFNDWTVNSFHRIRKELQESKIALEGPPPLALRRPSAIVGADSESVLGDDNWFRVEEGGGFLPNTGFLVEWRIGTSAGFLCSVLPVAPSAYWTQRWSWDGRNWFLHRLCLNRPWVVLKCPVCLTEFFWNVMDGAPMPACAGCKFTASKDDQPSSYAMFTEWAERQQQSAPDPDDIVWDDAKKLEVYRGACECYVDAVTGVQLPVQPTAFRVLELVADGYRPGGSWFLERTVPLPKKVRASREARTAEGPAQRDLLCPRCGWTSRASTLALGGAPRACPECGYGTGTMGAPGTETELATGPACPSAMPRDFAAAVALSVVALMNQRDVREAIAAIDSSDPHSAELYGRIFSRALPSLPTLSGSDVLEIARELKASIRWEGGQPVDIAENEVFAFLSRHLGGRARS